VFSGGGAPSLNTSAWQDKEWPRKERPEQRYYAALKQLLLKHRVPFSRFYIDQH
jgi:hypothetical protein